MKKLFRFLREEKAATAAEYAVMLALIIMMCIASVALVGENTRQLWSNNDSGLKSAFTGNGS